MPRDDQEFLLQDIGCTKSCGLDQCQSDYFKDLATGLCQERTTCDFTTQWEDESWKEEPGGSTPLSFRNRACKPITVCEPGMKTVTEPTYTSDRVCEPCPVGSVDHDSDRSTACETCNAGTYAPEKSFGPCSKFMCTGNTTDADSDPKTPCVECAAGQEVPQTSASTQGTIGTCKTCQSGTTDHDGNAATSCVSCGPGHGIEGDGSIGPCSGFECPAGESDINGKGIDCKDCPPGHFAPVKSVGTCKPCPAGSIDEDGNAATACKSCNAFGRGIYVESGQTGFCGSASTCLDSCAQADRFLCFPGHYDHDNSPDTPCKMCAPGTATSDSGALVCDVCEEGLTFSDAPGQTVCQSCTICNPNQYAATPCMKNADTVCMPCTVCAEDDNVTRVCGGVDGTEDRVCARKVGAAGVGSSRDGDENMSAIIGGVVGGVVFIAALAMVLVLYLRRRGMRNTARSLSSGHTPSVSGKAHAQAQAQAPSRGLEHELTSMPNVAYQSDIMDISTYATPRGPDIVDYATPHEAAKMETKSTLGSSSNDNNNTINGGQAIDPALAAMYSTVQRPARGGGAAREAENVVLDPASSAVYANIDQTSFMGAALPDAQQPQMTPPQEAEDQQVYATLQMHRDSNSDPGGLTFVPKRPTKRRNNKDDIQATGSSAADTASPVVETMYASVDTEATQRVVKGQSAPGGEHLYGNVTGPAPPPKKLQLGRGTTNLVQPRGPDADSQPSLPPPPVPPAEQAILDDVHEGLSRQEAESTIKEFPGVTQGHYLLRTSSRSPDVIVISLQGPTAKIAHYQFRRISPSGGYKSTNGQTFESLAAMISHYEDHADRVACALVTRIPRSDSASA